MICLTRNKICYGTVKKVSAKGLITYVNPNPCDWKLTGKYQKTREPYWAMRAAGYKFPKRKVDELPEGWRVCYPVTIFITAAEVMRWSDDEKYRRILEKRIGRANSLARKQNRADSDKVSNQGSARKKKQPNPVQEHKKGVRGRRRLPKRKRGR